MSLATFAIVLFAAALHATWNAIVKNGGVKNGGAAGDPWLTTVTVGVAGAVISAAGLAVVGLPAMASWRFIAASGLLEVIYFSLVAASYRHADMSVVYPLMRGIALTLVALGGVVLVGEPLALHAWLGIAAIVGGVLGMAAVSHRHLGATGAGLALATGAAIAGCTLIDGMGVRRSGSPAGYTLTIFLFNGLALGTWALVRHRAAFLAHVRQGWPLGLVGGLGMVSAYGLSLWAMTRAPLATVAALRETSILFALAISGLVLRERVGPGRVALAGGIAAGAVLLRLG